MEQHSKPLTDPGQPSAAWRARQNINGINSFSSSVAWGRSSADAEIQANPIGSFGWLDRQWYGTPRVDATLHGDGTHPILKYESEPNLPIYKYEYNTRNKIGEPRFAIPFYTSLVQIFPSTFKKNS